MVLVVQFDADEPAAGRRIGIDVHSHVVHGAAADADQLALRTAALEMQAAQHALAGAGVVVLDERQADACLTVALGLEGFEEEAAVIAEYFWLDDQYAGQRGFDDLHCACSCASK